MTLEIGSLLNNRYRIIEILGQGGMAAVYKAIDQNLGVEVCLKENLFTTEEYARQFRLEATILASLRQANLPRVSDHFVIEPQGQYLVMDYIEGEDLRQRLDRLGPLPEQEVIIVGVAISDALAYMHLREPMILHRDIKPGNVRITPNGHIYLVDFGLAKVVQGREATHTGARAMTPGYSPPEQYGTARTDPRSDIYSLGATLYSAITDVLPEDGLERAMNNIELTPIIKRNPRVSVNMASIIEKCLAVRAEDRYQTAEELRFALVQARSVSRRKLPLELVLQPPPLSIHDGSPEVEDGHKKALPAGSEITPGGGRKHTRLLNNSQGDIVLSAGKGRYPRKITAWILLALLPLLILSGIGLYGAQPQMVRQLFGFIPGLTTPTSETRRVVPTTTQVQVLAPITRTPTSTHTHVPTVTSSPTPTYTNTPEPTATITLTPTATPIGGSDQIAFASTRSGAVEIWLMNADGSEITQVTNIPEGACQPEWSPDGQRIVFISPCIRNLNSYAGASLFIINADGSGLMPLPNVPGGDYDPSWSPDGMQIAFTSLRNGGVPGIYILTLSDYSVKPLLQEETRAIAHPAWSPDGKMIAYVNSDNRVWITDAEGENQRDVTIGGGEYVISSPAWSPDGSAIIFTRTVFSDTTGSTVLMAVRYSETNAIPVEVPNSQLVTDVTYSQDGFWLLFTSWYSGNHEISMMRANGVDRQAILVDLAYDFDPAWRPNRITLP